MNAQDKKLFKEFLKLNKCYNRFKKCYNRYSMPKSNLRFYLNRIPASNILLHAFTWLTTVEGYEYWYTLHCKWQTYSNKSYE